MTEPFYLETPYSKKPMPPPFDNPLSCLFCPLCYCCLSSQLPAVHGISPHARTIDMTSFEAKGYLDMLKGNWKITPLQSDGKYRIIVSYTDAMVRDETMILTGGMHNRTHHVRGGRNITTAVANEAQKQRLYFYMDDQTGRLFADNMGSHFAVTGKHNILSAIESGEVEMVNSFGMRILFQRGWKHDGLAPPTQVGMVALGPDGIPIGAASTTVESQRRFQNADPRPSASSAGSAADWPSAASGLSAKDRLAELTELLADGLITEAEFQEKREQVLKDL